MNAERVVERRDGTHRPALPGRDYRLRELVSDLETILIQTANLESENDLEAVEFVKQGVAARGVLLKISLSEMGDNPADGKSSQPQVRRAIERSSA